MNYFPLEILLIIESAPVDEFKAHCKILGIKPILIETENKKLIGEQLMTSSKHPKDKYEERIKYIKEKLTEKGYNIIREKHEIEPHDFLKHPNHIYFESHFRLKLKKDFNRDIIVKICNKNNFHLSKNLFKFDKKFNYQMLTLREKDITIKEFDNKLDNMCFDLMEHKGIVLDKIEIEECIFDSNISVDNNWI